MNSRHEDGWAKAGMRTVHLRHCMMLSALLAAAYGNTQSNRPRQPQAPKGAAQSRAASAPMEFREIGRQAGVTTAPHSSTERKYIVETMGGGGVALFDCDNDGRLDIAVVNDSTIDRFAAGSDGMLTLYRQDGGAGNIHFTDVTSAAGLTARGWGMAIAVGDFDNDGLPDMYVTGYGHNVLYRNVGNCRFEDVTERAGVRMGGFSTGAAWADFDGDGYLDLFVARYVNVDLHHLPSLVTKGAVDSSQIIQAPDKLEGETDVLFRNKGDGTFEDVSVKAGVSDAAKSHGMGVVWGDYDNDGKPDLLVTNDSGPNYLYHNLGGGKFEDVGAATGAAYGANGEIYGNMAADFGDFNRDGLLDVVVTRYSKQPASIYRNDQQAFTDIAPETGFARDTKTFVKWGTGFGDFDNDGWPDILIANGNFSSLTDVLENEVRFREPLQLFRNLKGKSFEEVADGAGLNAAGLQSRRGTAIGDINNDGKVDFVVFNVNGPPSVFINESKIPNHWVMFRLVGSKSNRMAIGARVEVEAGGMTQIDEVRGGGSYNSSNDTRLHFGMGSSAAITKVEIRWPSGRRQEFKNIAADALYEVDEGGDLKQISAAESRTAK